MKRKILIIAGIVTALLFAVSYDVYARGGPSVVSTTPGRQGGYYGTRINYSNGRSQFVPSGKIYSNPTHVVSSIHIPPPGFPYEWFAKDAAESFMKNDLEIDIASTSKDEHMHDAANIKECMKIFVTSDGKKHEACILTFEKKEDLEAQQEHYLALNEKGELYNWSFVKDNMLVVLDGTVSEKDARLYEDSLSAMDTGK